MLVLVAVLGLLVGSFLNVVIHRVPRGESLLRPGSHCPRCMTPIRPWHNVPVFGWLLLRGRCAACREPIGVRYPLVEAATAMIFVAVTGRIGFTAELPAFLYLSAVGVALAMIDIDVKRLPNAIVLPSYVVAAALLLPAVLVDGAWDRALRAVLAAAVLWAGYFLVAVIKPGAMGFGDVKLAGLLGIYLGWVGWGAVAVGTFAGFFLGAIVGVALMAVRRAGRKSAVPFGPFMLAGALIAVLFAGPLASWYQSLLFPTV